MGGVQKKITGVTIHLDPQDDGRVKLIFALNGEIQEEEILTRAELRGRLPELGLRILGYLGGGASPLERGAVQLGKIMEAMNLGRRS